MKKMICLTIAICFFGVSANAVTLPSNLSGGHSLLTKVASCLGGKMYFEGQCMFKSELREYCGPGYTPIGTKCINNSELLEFGDSLITKAQCRQMGMIQDAEYCIEDH